MDNEAPVTRLDGLEDRFLEVVVDKAPKWFLLGALVLAAFIAVEQIILAVTK